MVRDRVRNHDKNLVVRSCTTILAVVRNRARQESCTTKIVHDKNRARQKSCATKIVHDVGLIRKKFRLIVLKYANFTNLDHLESILINFSAFLEKNYYFTSKNAPKIVDPAKKSCTTKSCTTEILS